ncbi:hypothetical protein FS749_004912 [Ceratobasidium sp. UAMH 11750]|nr:hypothetical protein FS749_004912 [Ceratobasidium sp. UAMH 11750]
MSHLALSTPPWQPERASMHRIHWFLTLVEPVSPLKAPSTPLSHPAVLNVAQSHASAEAMSDAKCSDSEASESGSEVDSEPESETTLQATCSEPRKIAPLPAPKLKQTQLGFTPISREEWLAQEDRQKQKLSEVHCTLAELEQEANEKKALRNKERERLKKQNQRARKKARKAADTLEARSLEAPCEPPPSPTAASGTSPGASMHLAAGVAELSRPHRHSKHILKDRKTEEKKAQRTNWMSPFLWSMIDTAARAVGYPWRPIDISNRLKKQHPELFAKFLPQRISDWRDSSITDRLVWKESVLIATGQGNHPQGKSVRYSILHEYPETLGIPLNITAICALMMAMIKEQAPDLFKRRLRADKLFQCSYSFVRSFLHKELNWSFRRPTRAAQNTPANLKSVLRHAFLRLACVIRDEEVPSCCIVNADQTQVVYSHGCEYTWTQQGAKQVSTVGKDEKRAYTLVVGVSNSGSALPFQAIYPGLTRASLPQESASGYVKAKEIGMLLELSMTKTYWATQATMRSYVERILVPYFREQIQAHGLPEDQRCIFQIDAWSVHRSAEFREWMASSYPWIGLQYIPGGCTGYFQACDVALQRVVKAAIHQHALEDLIDETSEAISSGAALETFKNSNLLKTLRDRSVLWMVKGYEAINKPDLIKKAFSLCVVPDSPFNLSYESLTSHAARKALVDLRVSDPDFYRELMMGKSTSLPDAIVEDEFDAADGEAMDCSLDELQNVVMNSSTAVDLEETLANYVSNAEVDDMNPPLETGATTPVEEVSQTQVEEPRTLRRSKRKRQSRV